MARRSAPTRRGATTPLRLLLASALSLRSAFGAALPYVPGTVHTIFSTECNRYFDWQSLGLVHSARKVGQSGPITRLMACNDASYETGIDVETHTHPNWAVHPITGDHYSPYNKPASIVHWLEHAKPTAEYVIILDADMIIRNPMTAELVGAERGRPVSAHYGYLKGIFKENYMKVKERVKNVEKAQQVGGFSVMHIEDLKLVAPLWLKWTEEVRADPESWGNTGDIFNANGKAGPPWISEMYGYVFACAEVGLDFKVSDKFMLYPGYAPPAAEPWPVVMHYGVTYNVFDYAFDKHWYMSTDMTSCPAKLFQKPPTLASLPVEPGSAEHRRLDVALSVAWGLYDATREHAITACGIADPPDPPQIRYKCAANADNVVVCRQRAENDFDPPPPPGAALVGAGTPFVGAKLRGGGGACADDSESCCGWAESGECAKNAGFMLQSCARACGLCPKAAGSCLRAADTPPPPAPVAISDAKPGKKAGKGGAGLVAPPAPRHVDPALAHQVPERKLKPHVAGAHIGKSKSKAKAKAAEEPVLEAEEEAENEEAEEEVEEAQPGGEEVDEEPQEPEAEEEAQEADEEPEELEEEEVRPQRPRGRIAIERSRDAFLSTSDSSSDAAASRRLGHRVALAAWPAGAAAACLGLRVARKRRAAARGHGGSHARARLSVAASPAGRMQDRKGV